MTYCVKTQYTLLYKMHKRGLCQQNLLKADQQPPQ